MTIKTTASAVLGRIFARPKVAAAIIIPLVLVGLLVAPFGAKQRTVTAHFANAISIFPGTDVTIMGVRVGRVLTIEPQGSTVEVTMEYDADYRLPADVKAALVTPTLVADRYVQLVPAYSGTGPTLADKGDIPIDRSVTPVEMDEIYTSLQKLTDALGPNAINKDGALGYVMHEGANALKGNGALGHETVKNMSEAAKTFGDNSENLFATVEGLAALTKTLQEHDNDVSAFMDSLGTVSMQLAGESDDLKAALAAIADAVHVTRGFVKKNKRKLIGDLDKLSTTLGVLAAQKKSLATTLQLAPLGLANLADGFDTPTGTEGARFQFGPLGSDITGVLCNVMSADGVPNADQACDLLRALLPAAVTDTVGPAITGNFGFPSIPPVNPTPTISSLVDQVSGLAGIGSKVGSTVGGTSGLKGVGK